MPVAWTFRDGVLTLSVSGVASNHEIERAVADALAEVTPGTGARLLWDARETETPLTADDIAWRFELVSELAERDMICRAALLVREEQSSLLRLGRTEMGKAVRGLRCDAFTDEPEALAWLGG